MNGKSRQLTGSSSPTETEAKKAERRQKEAEKIRTKLQRGHRPGIWLGEQVIKMMDWVRQPPVRSVQQHVLQTWQHLQTVPVRV
jgi:hypothetical protein